jgi:hypothetical protein
MSQQYLYLIKVKSEKTGKFLVYRAATTLAEVEKVRKAKCASELDITRYKKDKKIE